MVLEAVDAVLAQQPTSGTVGSRFNALHPIFGSAPALFGIGIHLYVLEPTSSPEPHFDIQITKDKVNSAAKHLIVVRVHIRADRMNPPVDLDQRAQRSIAGPITVDDMVPGDHVYMENKADYGFHYPTGAWNGENAIYMEKGRFAGLGVGLVTEDQLQRELADAYNLAPNDRHPEAKAHAQQTDMQWTLIAAPSLFGGTDGAGRFTNR
jgi:Protein-glutamine gamma-glutamyltransferase